MLVGVILVAVALGVLFEKLPGNQIAWIVVLVCGLALLLVAPPIELPWRRRPPDAP